jgi:hypothetical protein
MLVAAVVLVVQQTALVELAVAVMETVQVSLVAVSQTLVAAAVAHMALE